MTTKPYIFTTHENNAFEKLDSVSHQPCGTQGRQSSTTTNFWILCNSPKVLCETSKDSLANSQGR